MSTVTESPSDPARRVVCLDNTDGATSLLSDAIDLPNPIKTQSELLTSPGGAGPPYYRGIRVDVAGTVKFDYVTSADHGTLVNGVVRATGTRNLAAGEILLYPIVRIYLSVTSATGIDGIL